MGPLDRRGMRAAPLVMEIETLRSHSPLCPWCRVEVPRGAAVTRLETALRHPSPRSRRKACRVKLRTDIYIAEDRKLPKKQ